jgi:hypothetical protein
MIRTTTCLLLLLGVAALARGQTRPPGPDVSPSAEPAPPPRLLGPPEPEPAAPPTPYPWPVADHHGFRPGPYFEADPLVDDQRPYGCPPQPGWFADVEVGGVIPHVKDFLIDTVQLVPLATPPAALRNSLGKPPTAVVQVPHVPLGWTATPHVEFGYRLPEAWGELLVGYRFLGSESSASAAGVGAPHGLLQVHVIDLEYASRQIDLPWHWDVRWKAGVRMGQNLFENQFDVPAVPGANGVTQLQDHNRFVGIGPIAGLELTSPCHPELPGLRLYGRFEASSLVGRVAQNSGLFTTTAGGFPIGGTKSEEGSVAVPILGGELGLSWQPPGWDGVLFSLGYGLEHWWSIGRIRTGPSSAEMGVQGVFFRTQINF